RGLPAQPAGAAPGAARGAAGSPGAFGQLPCGHPRQRRADHLRGKPGVRQDAQPGRERIAIAKKGRKREGYDVSGEDAGRGDAWSGDASGGGVTGDEAAWRDLVARFSLPADPTEAPWPEREGLTPGPAHVAAAGGEDA